MEAGVFSNTVNYVKGVAILLVVLGHIASPFGAAIFSFHIPLFFFLGGIFIKTTYAPAEFLKRNLNRLVVPYLIFGALGLLVNDVKIMLLHRPPQDFAEDVTGLLFWMDAKHLQHYGLVLWFLPALFWARAMSYGLLKYSRLGELPDFALCVAMAFFSASVPEFALPFGLDKGVLALPWVYAGAIFMRHKGAWLKMPAWGAMLAALFACLIVYFSGFPPVNMAEKGIGQMWITLPYTLAVVLLLIFCAHKLSLNAPVEPGAALAALGLTGSESMLIYVLHPYTNNGAYLISTYFLGEGFWAVKFALTMAMLWVVLQIKLHRPGLRIFNYL